MRFALIAIGAVFISGVLFLACKPRLAARGTYDQIESRLDGLKRSTDPKAFVGFCTKNTDALYFVFEHGTYNLDYELYDPEKAKFAEPFRKVAGNLGHKVQETTYGSAPVLRVDLGPNTKQAAEQGFQFAHQLFGLEKATNIEFLP